MRMETLSQAPRVLTNYLSTLKIRCDYFERGCVGFHQLGHLKSHVEGCGFSPVLCSNDGCLAEINKRDRTHHEAEVCEFRKLKCHDCAAVRREMDEIKDKLKVMIRGIKEEIIKDTRKMMAEMKDEPMKPQSVKQSVQGVACVQSQASQSARTSKDHIYCLDRVSVT